MLKKIIIGAAIVASATAAAAECRDYYRIKWDTGNRIGIHITGYLIDYPTDDNLSRFSRCLQSEIDRGTEVISILNPREDSVPVCSHTLRSEDVRKMIDFE